MPTPSGKHRSISQSSYGRVLVHCYAGISSSATIVLAYLMVHEKMHLHIAIKLLKEKHKISKPNQGFMNQLLRFYHRIKQKNGEEFFRTESCYREEWGPATSGIGSANLSSGRGTNFAEGLKQKL